MSKRAKGARVLGPYSAGRKGWRVFAVGFDGRRRPPRYFHVHADAQRYANKLRKGLEARSIAETIDAYEQHRRTIGAKDATIEADLCRLNCILERSDPLSMVNATYLELRGNAYVEAGGAATYADSMVRSVRRMLKWAVKQDFLEPVDLSEIHIRGERKAGKDQLTVDESVIFLELALADGDKRQRRLGVGLAMGLLMGLSPGEILPRKVKDFDNRGTELRVMEQTKNAHRVRIQYIPTEPHDLQARIADLCRGKGPDDPIIGHGPGERTFYATKVLCKFAHEVCELAGVSDVTAQGLRGSWATHRTERGGSVSDTSRSMGHATEAMTTGHYIKPDVLKNAEIRKVSLRLMAGGKQ